MNSHSSIPAAYDRFTPPLYDRLHARFLRLSGGEGQSAIEGAVTALLRPGMCILDAGCGTGHLARRLLQTEPQLDMTLLDCSPKLLRASCDLPVRRLYGDLTNLALPDRHFDLTFALWVIEASGDPLRAIRELHRITRPGGHVGLLFCSRTETSDMIDRIVERAVIFKGTGQFLQTDAVADELIASGADQIRRLACRGPATALLARTGARP